MKYRKIGNSGLEVSAVTLGCMSYGDAARGNHGWTLPEEESRSFIKNALELGITTFDTANIYSIGSSEEILGRALKDFAKREEVVVATKVHGTMRPGPNGLVPRTDPAIAEAILAGDIAARPRWEAIAAPSLAFYSSKDVAEQVPPEANTAQRTAFIDYSVRMLRPWMLRQQADFLARRRCGTAVEVPHSSHHLFLERPAWLASRILAFLAEDTPCAPTIDDAL